MEQFSQSRREIESHLVARALRDDGFRQMLIDDPKTAVQNELARLRLDITLAPGLKVKVLEENPDTLYLILPPDVPATQTAPEEFFLEAIRGLELDRD